MSQQIAFFNKSACDISNTEVVATASEGQTYVEFMFNRSNLSAWVTTGSVDANNTNIVVDFVDQEILTDIILILHNFKSYTIQYWNGSSYVDFSTPINVSGNTSATTRHTFNSVTTTKIKLIITGTMVANSDKYLYQFIATSSIGQFAAWPEIRKPTLSRNRQKSLALSGKMAINEQVGAYSTTINLQSWQNSADLTILESLFSANKGFLVWLCGGDESQFSPQAPMGYRLQDLFLMKCQNEYSPEYYSYIYKCGIKIQMDLVEVID